MAKTESIRARVDPELKRRAEAVMKKLGLSVSDAIRLYYAQIDLRKGLPFDVVIPNAKTRRAMRDIEEGRDLTWYADTDEMFDKLGL
jgi:DNA-damage-inducible protein J